MPATSTRHSGWQFRQAGGHQGNSDISAVYEGTEVTRMTGSAYTINLKTFIGASTNEKNTLGLTIDQGTNDDEIFSLKSSDVTHARVSIAETDTYFMIMKDNAGAGATRLTAISEDTADRPALSIHAHGMQAGTDKNYTGFGMIDLRVLEHTVTDTVANITANGNVFSVSAWVGDAARALFIVDEDGDLFADAGTSTDAVTVYDDMPDAMMVRALDKARSDVGGLGFVRGQWDDFTDTNEQALVETGILGAPLAEGGLVNVTRLQQLHNGAIWQLWSDVLDVAKALPAAAQEKLPDRIKDRFLALNAG